jgi:hypothetical protein
MADQTARLSTSRHQFRHFVENSAEHYKTLRVELRTQLNGGDPIPVYAGSSSGIEEAASAIVAPSGSPDQDIAVSPTVLRQMKRAFVETVSIKLQVAAGSASVSASAIAGNGAGLTLNEFIDIVNGVGYPALGNPNVFALFDWDGNTLVSYKEFMLTLCALLNAPIDERVYFVSGHAERAASPLRIPKASVYAISEWHIWHNYQRLVFILIILRLFLSHRGSSTSAMLDLLIAIYSKQLWRRCVGLGLRMIA